MAVLIILACVLDVWRARGTLAGNTEVRGGRGGSHSMAVGLNLETHAKVSEHDIVGILGILQMTVQTS